MNEESADTECRTVLDEVAALRSEIEEMQDGQVVVIFYDRLEPVTQLLESAGAVPVSAVGEVNLIGAARQVKAYSTIGA